MIPIRKKAHVDKIYAMKENVKHSYCRKKAIKHLMGNIGLVIVCSSNTKDPWYSILTESLFL